MKKYVIFISIAALITIAFIGIPQLTGTVFVNNDQDRIPIDWLSAQVIKMKKKESSLKHDIPENVTAIKFTGSARYNRLTIKSHHRGFRFSENQDIDFQVVGDTLMITDKSAMYVTNFTLYVDENITKFVCSNLKGANIHVHQTAPLDLHIENESNVTLYGNRNMKLKKMAISGNSTYRLAFCFTPVIDMEIDNSMVYIEIANSIDSIKAHLIGKSNIKKEQFAYRDQATEALFAEMQGIQILDTDTNEVINTIKYAADIYPSGNLAYYHR